MKKFLAVYTALAAFVSISTAAVADTYEIETNTVNVDGTGYSTVLIEKKDKPGDIVYIGQNNDSAFGTSVNFLIKNDPDAGFYTIRLGGGSHDVKEKHFYIGSADEIGKYASELSDTVKLTLKYTDEAEDGMVDIGFISDSAMEVSNIRTILVKKGSNYYAAQPSTTFTGSANALIGVQIKGIEASQKNDIEVYVCSVELQGGN